MKKLLVSAIFSLVIFNCSCVTAKESTTCNAFEYQTSEDEKASYARCLLNSNQFEESIPLLTELYSIDQHPVYLADIGRAYLGLQQFELARGYFLKALEANPPEEAKKLLLRFLQLAEQNTTISKEWSIRASIGYLFEDNVNFGPTQQQVNIFGLPFILNKESMPKSDHAKQINLSSQYYHASSSRVAWQLDTQLEFTRYNQYSNQDVDFLYLQGGPHFIFKNGNLDFYSPLSIIQFNLGHNTFYKSLIYNPQVRLIHDENNVSNLDLQIIKREFNNSNTLDFNGKSLSYGINHFFNKSISINPAVKVGYEQAHDSSFSNNQNGLSLGVNIIATEDIRITLETNYLWVKYEDAEFTANESRKETRVNNSLSISKHLFSTHYLNANWQYQRHHSNIDIYDLQRNQFTIEYVTLF